jgi:hypothetical protein
MIKVELIHHVNILTHLLWYVTIDFPCESTEHLSNDSALGMYPLLHFLVLLCLRNICFVSNRCMNVGLVNEMHIDLYAGFLGC